MKKRIFFAIVLFLCFSLLFSADWDMISKLTASDRSSDDYLGKDVAISGNWAIVGAGNESQSVDEGGSIHHAGAAYFFRFNGSGWVETQKIVAPDRGEDHYFGKSVDLCGNYAIVGAHREEVGSGYSEGVAYIYHYDGVEWEMQERIYADDRQYGDYFGSSVAMTEDHAVIGAIYQDYAGVASDSISQAGAAYVFSRSGESWGQVDKLTALYRSADANFGETVDISGTRIVVGVPLEDMDADSLDYEMNAGAVYVFHKNISGWDLHTKLLASDRNSYDQFGYSVAIDGTTIAVGAYMEDHDADGLNNEPQTGSAYVFDFNGTAWTETQKIVASERWDWDLFGSSIDIDDNIIVVGARQEDHDTSAANYVANGGAVYVFEKSGTWQETEKITDYYRRADDEFGGKVSLSGDVLIVGTLGNDLDSDNLNLINGAGAAFVFSTGIGGTLESNIGVFADTVEILNGDNTPSLIDQTDFGTIYVDSAAVIHTFTIENSGTGDLMIDTLYVYDSLFVNFTLSTDFPRTISPGGSDDFSVSFTPEDSLFYWGTVYIWSNAPGNSPYSFKIQGQGAKVEVAIDNASIPYEFALLPAYPNPFNPETVISMRYAEGSNSVVNIYNIQGVLIDNLINGYVEAGNYNLVWNAQDKPSGVYIVKMTAGDFVASQKIVLIK